MTQDKIKEVLKKVAEDLEVDTTYIEEKNVHLDRIVEITLKSYSEEISQVELQKEFHWDRIKELEKTIKSLHLQNIDLIEDKKKMQEEVNTYKELAGNNGQDYLDIKAEQKAKVEKLKRKKVLQKFNGKTDKDFQLFLLEKGEQIGYNKCLDDVDKIFSPEEADLQERK